MELKTDVFKIYDKKWALVTSGTPDDFNTMTISWGGLGTIWNKPVATVYIRTSRLTHEYMDKNEYFSVCFFPEQYKETLGILGAKSGREIDKMHIEGLTPRKEMDTVVYDEADITLVCRKLFVQELDPSKIPSDIVDKFYNGIAPHDMYIGEVVSVF